MIDRKKKKFVVLVIGLSLYLASAAKSQHLSITTGHFRHRKLLTMTRKPCQDAEGNKGVCIFKWDCLSQEGVSLSTCVDGFLFGSCCKLKVEPEIFPSDKRQNENRIDITTRVDERKTTTDDIQSKNSSDPAGKTSDFESYYSGVTYSFHSDNIDAQDQDANQDGAGPLIYTLANKVQHGHTEEMDGNFTVPKSNRISSVTTAVTEALFRVSETQSSFINESNEHIHDASSKTETYFYNNESSLAAASFSAISSANIPIVYTLTSPMPIVYNHSIENVSVLVSNSFDRNESEGEERTMTSISNSIIPLTEDPELSKGTNQTSMSLVEVTEQYSFGPSSDNVSGFIDVFHTLEMGETDSVMNTQNSESDLYDAISTLENTLQSDKINFSAVQERNKTTQVDDFTAEITTVHPANDSSTNVEELHTETVPFHGNSSTERDNETSHSGTVSSFETVYIPNVTHSDFYSDPDIETNLPSFVDTETQDGTPENFPGTSHPYFYNSEGTTASKLLADTVTTSSIGFSSESLDRYSTLELEDDSSLRTTSVRESEKLPEVTSTLLVSDSTSVSETLNTVINKTESPPILSENETQSYTTESETVSISHYYSPSDTPSLNEYNYEIINTPEYNTNATKLTFDLASLLEKYNSSFVTTQDSDFDSTWFLIKLSEFFWGNFTLNESTNLAPEAEEITTLPNHNDSESNNMQPIMHPTLHPTETQTHKNPPNYSIPNTSSDILQSSVTSSLLGYQTDVTDRDETIYQNLLSIMEYNGKSTTPVDNSQNSIKSITTNTFGDTEEPDQFFQKPTISDYTVTNLKDGATKTATSTTNEYDPSEASEYTSTIHNSSLIYNQTDATYVTDFVTEIPDLLDTDTTSYTISLATEHAFTESNIVDKNIQTDKNMETNSETHTPSGNLHDISYNYGEYFTTEPPQKTSLFEDTTSSEASNYEVHFSTKDPLMSETESSTTADTTENDLISSPDSQEYGLSEANTNLTSSPDSEESGLPEMNTVINVTKEVSAEASHSPASHFTVYPITQDETTMPSSSDFNVTVSIFTDLTTLNSAQEETTTQTSLNFTGDVVTHFAVITSAADAETATHIYETDIDSSTATDSATTNKEMKTSTDSANVSQDETLLTTTSEKETTIKLTTLEMETTINSESTLEKEDTTKSTISETVMLAQLTTIPTTAPSTSNDPTYTTQKYTIPQELPSPPQLDYRKSCGVRTLRPTARIVGGKDTFYGKWPWQALVKEAAWLGLFVKNKCGGVLINSKFVITAAHCQPGFLGTLIVVLGAHDLTGAEDYLATVARNVKRMVIHRHYNAQTFENDLALLEMESPVEFLPHVVPICLPHRTEVFTGKMAFVTGWGKLTHGGDVPNILQEVQVPIVTNGDCQKMYLYAGHEKMIRSHFVCAGYSRGGQDSCEGDSGGPLMVQRDDGRWVLVGTVSHGIGCADPNLPGVYMRMSAYRPWIDSIIRRRKVVRQKQVNSTSVMRKKIRRSRTLVFYI